MGNFISNITHGWITLACLPYSFNVTIKGIMLGHSVRGFLCVLFAVRKYLVTCSAMKLQLTYTSPVETPLWYFFPSYHDLFRHCCLMWATIMTIAEQKRWNTTAPRRETQGCPNNLSNFKSYFSTAIFQIFNFRKMISWRILFCLSGEVLALDEWE